MSQTICESVALLDENLISMKEACESFPMPVSRSSIEKMIRRGTRGVRLETIFFCNKRYTSREAIRRFIERIQNTDEKPKEQEEHKAKTMSKTDLEAGRKKFNLPVPD